MTHNGAAAQPKPTGLRILIVDNIPKAGQALTPLLALWGHTAYLAESRGEQTIEHHAIALVAAHRCQIAVVDMRLHDERDPEDLSGLKLVSHLKPAVAIIRSSFGDYVTAREALKQYGAFYFVGKEEHTHVLKAAIEDAARSVAAGGTGPTIIWELVDVPADSSPEQSVLSQLFPSKDDLSPNTQHQLPGREEIPPDEVSQIVGMLFPGKSRVMLRPMAHEEASVTPSTDVVLRRSSRVFEAIVDNEPRRRVVKLARTGKIDTEVTQYQKHVENGLPAALRTQLESKALLWDLGGIVYNYLGQDDDLVIFRAFYQQQKAKAILRPLKAHFKNWSHWYRNEARQLHRSLFSVYDELWNGALSERLGAWGKEDAILDLPGLGRVLPNPMRWLLANRADSLLRDSSLREAITHGDLHSDNLIANANHAFPIDFERTGYGPILRDFIELIQDLSTRVAWALDGQDTGPDLLLIYELAVAWCAPDAPGQPLPWTDWIAADAAAAKLHEVVHELRLLAHRLTHYVDQRELLWGLLLNHLFVEARLWRGSERWLRTVLFAAVICGRLERWGRGPWPPPEWPQVQWR